MILIIDTSADDKFTVALARGNGFLFTQKSVAGRFIHSEKLLPAIDYLMKKLKINYSQLKGITVTKGPGGFTALRIGINTANTLAYALKIPVAGFLRSEYGSLRQLAQQSPARLKRIKSPSMVRPFYGCQPNITRSKK